MDGLMVAINALGEMLAAYKVRIEEQERTIKALEAKLAERK